MKRAEHTRKTGRRHARADRVLAEHVELRGMTHGFNEIFTAMGIATDLLLGSVTDPEQRQLLEYARRNAERGAALARRLSMLGRESADSMRDDATRRDAASSPDVANGATSRVYAFPRPTPAAPAPREKRIVLVVEDHDDVRDLLERVLTGAGYAVRTAAHSRAALTALATLGEQVGLVIADLILPHMNGWALAHTVQRTHPDMKFLFLTGFPANVPLPRSDDTNGETCLRKPVRVQDVLARVAQLMETRGRRDAVDSNSARTVSARATEGAGWMNGTI